jgi:hypothetical protein
LGEPQEHRCANSTSGQIINNFFEVGGASVTFGGTDDKVSFAIYVKVAGAPIFNAIGFKRLLNCRGQFAVS